MGYSGVLALAFMCIVVISSIAAIMVINFSIHESIGEAIGEEANIRVFTLGEELRIDDGYISQDGHEVFINITNVGEASVPIKDFKFIDVIVVYKDVNKNVKILWVPYEETPNQLSDCWFLNDVFIDNRSGDIINPIRISSTGCSGLWDPGETIEITIYLKDQISAEGLIFILICSPRGRKASITL
ncbi:MAG: hypothetical protein J7J99_00650 [Thermoprotei archaeon]|nr:hypothetical protein [Thermoprotei archaeon]